MALLAPTGKHGGVRVDQGHVTAAPAGALTKYGRIDPGDNSGHYGIGFTADLNLIDGRKLPRLHVIARIGARVEVSAYGFQCTGTYK